MKPDVLQWFSEHLTEDDLRELVSMKVKPPAVTPSLPSSGANFVVKGVKHEYSTVNPFNADSSLLFLLHPHGAVGLHHADGRFYMMFPSVVNHSSEMRWDRKEPTIFYFKMNNRLMRFDISRPWESFAITTVREFKESPAISMMGEADMSWDGEHLPMASGRDVWVYNLKTDKKIWHFTAPWAFNNLYLTPSNTLLLTTAQGVMHYHGHGFTKVTSTPGHMDVGRDSAGDDVLIWTNANENPITLKDYENGIIKVRIADGKQTGLMWLPWNFAVHISCPDKPWAIVSAFDPANGDVPGNAIYRVPMERGIEMTIGTHGSHVERGKTQDERYDLQPKASINHAGTHLVWDSNGDTHIAVL